MESIISNKTAVPCTVTPAVVPSTRRLLRTIQSLPKLPKIRIFETPPTPRLEPEAADLFPDLVEPLLSVSNSETNTSLGGFLSPNPYEIENRYRGQITRGSIDILDVNILHLLSPESEAIYPKYDRNGANYQLRRNSFGIAPWQEYKRDLKGRRNSLAGGFMTTTYMPKQESTESYVARFCRLWSGLAKRKYGNYIPNLPSNTSTKETTQVLNSSPSAPFRSNRQPILSGEAVEFRPALKGVLKSADQLPTSAQGLGVTKFVNAPPPSQVLTLPSAASKSAINSTCARDPDSDASMDQETEASCEDSPITSVPNISAKKSVEIGSSRSEKLNLTAAEYTPCAPLEPVLNLKATESSLDSITTPSKVSDPTTESLGPLQDSQTLLALISGHERIIKWQLIPSCPYNYPYGSNYQQSGAVKMQQSDIEVDMNDDHQLQIMAGSKWERAFIPSPPPTGVSINHETLKMYLLKQFYHRSVQRKDARHTNTKFTSNLLSDKNLARLMNRTAVENGWTEDKKIFSAAKIRETVQSHIWCVVGEKIGSERTGIMVFPSLPYLRVSH